MNWSRGDVMLLLVVLLLAIDTAFQGRLAGVW